MPNDKTDDAYWAALDAGLAFDDPDAPWLDTDEYEAFTESIKEPNEETPATLWDVPW